MISKMKMNCCKEDAFLLIVDEGPVLFEAPLSPILSLSSSMPNHIQMISTLDVKGSMPVLIGCREKDF